MDYYPSVAKLPVVVMPKPRSRIVRVSIESLKQEPEEEEEENVILQSMREELQQLPSVVKKQRRVCKKKLKKEHKERNSIEILRRELERSRESKEKCENALALRVERSLSLVKFNRINNEQTAAYAKKLALRRLVAVMELVTTRLCYKGLRRWRRVVVVIKREAQKRKEEQAEAALLIRHYLFSLHVQRPLRTCLHFWQARTSKLKEIEEARVRLHASIELQRCYRGHCGRRRAQEARCHRKFMIEQKAALIIQAYLYHGVRARAQAAALRKVRKQQDAAIAIQASWRSRFCRRALKMSREYRREIQAAKTIQSAERSRRARCVVTQKKIERYRHQAALVLQCYGRTHLAQRMSTKLRCHKQTRAGAICIQKRARGLIARRFTTVLAAKRGRIRQLRKTAATRIQSQARRRLCRKVYLESLRIRNIHKAKSQDAALKIQCMLRGFLSRKYVKPLIKERSQNMIQDAKACHELFDADSMLFYYANEHNKTAEWEPPRTGYKRRDGILVLADGREIEDPTDILGEARRAANAANAAADFLLGQLGERATAALDAMRTFLAERLALDGFDVRQVRDKRFQTFCDTLQATSNDLTKTGRIGTQEEQQYSAHTSLHHSSLDSTKEDDHSNALVWAQYDDGYGTPYYYNYSTAESTYERPEHFFVPPEESTQKLTTDWVQTQDADGNWFWYNTTTNESYYDEGQLVEQNNEADTDPANDSNAELALVEQDDKDDLVLTPHQSVAENETETVTEDQGEWVQYQDEETGEWYWWNQYTGESRAS